MTALFIAAATLLAVVLIMLGEAALSSFNERLLRAREAIEVDDGVVRTMQWAYPASFAAMAAEGALAGPSTPELLPIGLALFGVSKALKVWTIRTLGVRWTFRILVVPDAPLVTHGPYVLMRHPNYVAILGEMAAVALIVWAPVTGVLAFAGYGALLRRKAAVEDRALGRQ
ncbi:MAG TPA: isoprenylcysteine carboxylmethyltransferase family protein [Vicinamibacterales bacterium]|nr:isoprenylcysteine carboxylmethyltransferase family protein [Vicinamibacterales bacterium]